MHASTHAAAAVSLSQASQLETDSEIEEILDESADAIESRLAALSQGLVETYRGGMTALERGGPDWQRHSMVSFRELSTHVLHLLAPDDEVIPNASADDLHNGRPTRRARLNHIFIQASGSSIASFYEADREAGSLRPTA
jgi:hypothetical protein